MTNSPNQTLIRILAMPDDDAAISLTIRDLLIDDSILNRPTDCPLSDADLDALHDAIRNLDSDILFTLRLEYSLCPIHSCDYAICFDDDNPECADIRALFPSHDT